MLVKQKKFRKSEKKFNFPWPASAHSQCTGNVQNDGHKKMFGKKISENTSTKKFSSKMEKEKKTKIVETKIVELFTVSLKILSSSCAQQ